MPWQITGVFQRINPDYTTGDNIWQQDQVAGIKVIAYRHDIHDQDIADGIEQCLNRSGYNAMAANLNMGGFKITNIGTATGLTDLALYGQCAGSMDWEDSVANTLRLLDRNGSVIDSVVIPTSGSGGGITSLTGGTAIVATPATITISGSMDLVDLHGVTTALTGGIASISFDKYGRVLTATAGAYANTNLSNSQGLINTTIYSSTGTGTVILNATAARSGVMAASDKVKLDTCQAIYGGTYSPNFSGISLTENGEFQWYRIGDTVHVYGRIEWTGKTGTDTTSITITGLPYAAEDTTYDLSSGSISRCEGVDFGAVQDFRNPFLGCRAILGTTTVGLFLNYSIGEAKAGVPDPAAGQSLRMGYNQMGADGYIELNLHYRTTEVVGAVTGTFDNQTPP